MWRLRNESDASGGRIALIGGKPGAKVVFPYSGRCVRRVYTAAHNRGVVEVRLDGVIVDTYNERRDGVWRQSTKDFCAGSSGQHTFEVKMTTPGNDRFIDVDRFDIDPTTAVAVAQVKAAGESGEGTIYQQDHEAIDYIGDWRTFEAEDASSGALAFTENQWDGVIFRFEGTQVEWCYSKALNRGEAAILIDGDNPNNAESEQPVKVDLYGGKIERNQCWTSPKLELGEHYIHIVATGEKHAGSSGTLVDVDHFIVH